MEERTTTGMELVRDTYEKVDLIRNVFSRLRADIRAMSTDGGKLRSLRWVIMSS